MTKRLTFVLAVGATLAFAPLAANASPVPEEVPPACVAVEAAPVNLQLGYSPNGPSDCTVVTPPPAQ